MGKLSECFGHSAEFASNAVSTIIFHLGVPSEDSWDNRLPSAVVLVLPWSGSWSRPGDNSTTKAFSREEKDRSREALSSFLLLAEWNGME